MPSAPSYDDILIRLGVDSLGSADAALLEECRLDAVAAIEAHLRYQIEPRIHTEYYPQNRKYPNERDSFTWESHNGRAIAVIDLPFSDKLYVRNLPLRADDSLEVYEQIGARGGQTPGSFPVETKLTYGTDYYVENVQDGISMTGGLIRVAGGWPVEELSVKVVYNSGFTSSEMLGTATASYLQVRNLRTALIETTIHHFKRSKIQQKTAGAGWVAGAISTESLGGHSYTVQNAGEYDFTTDIPESAMRRLSTLRSYAGIFG